LAQLGATVNAIDISLEMIRFATSTRPHPAITYQVGDMRHPTGGPWDMAICLGNSLSLLNSHNEVQNTLHTLYTVLAPDSTFLCQTLNYTSSDAQHPRHRIEEKYSENSTILAAKTLIPRNDHTLLSLAFFAEHNGRYTTRADTAILLHLSDEQITAYAKNAGFSVENKYGDFSKSPYQPNHSPDLIFVLRKPA